MVRVVNKNGSWFVEDFDGNTLADFKGDMHAAIKASFQLDKQLDDQRRIDVRRTAIEMASRVKSAEAYFRKVLDAKRSHRAVPPGAFERGMADFLVAVYHAERILQP